jgi:hypothetical protein
MMHFFVASVRNGRLTLDESTDLPDDAFIELVSTDVVVWPVQLSPSAALLDADERAVLAQELEASIAEADAGETFDFGEIIAELRARHVQNEATRPAVEPAAPQQLTQPFKAHVRNRRLVIDEPTDLPDGTLVELVSIDDVLATGGHLLDNEERAALDRELEVSFAEEEAGQLIDLADALADLKK